MQLFFWPGSVILKTCPNRNNGTGSFHFGNDGFSKYHYFCLEQVPKTIQLEFVEMIGGKKHFLSSDAESSGNVYNGKWPL